MVAKRMADKMASYLPILGIDETTMPAIDDWIDELLDQLDLHFTSHQFLLGGRPCIGDFALFGPLYAHVWRDPGSRHRVESRPEVLAWIHRLRAPDGHSGHFLAGDEIPETLHPILQRMFREQWPVLAETVRAVENWIDAHPGSSKMARGLGPVECHIGDARGSRKMLSFQQWMLQRPLDIYHGLTDIERDTVAPFLDGVGGGAFTSMVIRRRLARTQYRIVPA
jgi:hypothetical protein